ncbi:MAG TPA: hypothetical protein VFG55_06305 [Rhodanobacteraceae bacterium]|nr:hypothetical protein [Rhodanobacteraceae bacterium]
MKLIACVVVSACSLAGCATYRPLVDMDGVQDRRQYQYDLADCQAYARQVSPVASAGVGALFGALLGAAFGAAVGDRDLALDVARFGAVEGAAAGGIGGGTTQVQIIRNCMSGRGYIVLN